MYCNYFAKYTTKINIFINEKARYTYLIIIIPRNVNLFSEKVVRIKNNSTAILTWRMFSIVYRLIEYLAYFDLFSRWVIPIVTTYPRNSAPFPKYLHLYLFFYLYVVYEIE